MSLRTYILSLIMILVLSLTAFLSFQSARYLINGFRYSHEKLMIEIAEKHIFSNSQPVIAYDYHIATQWQDVPDIIREKVKQPSEFDYLYEEFENWSYFSPPETIYAILKTTTPSGEVRFISRIFRSHEKHEKHDDEFWHIDPMVTILLLGIAIIGIFYLIIFLVMRHIANPVESLYLWAQSLKMDRLEPNLPDFRYKELNSLAQIIHSNIHSAKETLKREQEFLQYASHELRTPIAVLRSNSSLLDKVSPTPSPQEAIIRQRIHRAGLTMKGMTETLLWLSREEQDDIPTDSIELDILTHEIIQDLNYLLQGKAIELKVETSPFIIDLPAEASRILLSNLIRNAFQHSTSGSITITQSDDQVKITNTHDAIGTDNMTNNDVGFGLGLKLCQKLVDRFNWSLSMENNQSQHSVSIHFKQSNSLDTEV